MGEVRALPAAAREVLSEAPPATVGHAGAHSRRAASGVTSLWNCLRVDGTELAALERGAVRVDHWRSGDDIVFARTTDGAKVTAHPLADHAARAVDRLGRMIDMTGERPKALSSHVLALTGGDPRGGLSPRPFDFASVKEVAEVRRTRRNPPAFVAAGILLGASRRCHPWLLRGRAAPNGRL